MRITKLNKLNSGQVFTIWFMKTRYIFLESHIEGFTGIRFFIYSPIHEMKLMFSTINLWCWTDLHDMKEIEIVNGGLKD
jgi:hypothetical protein